jgi:hypothetical protein
MMENVVDKQAPRSYEFPSTTLLKYLMLSSGASAASQQQLTIRLGPRPGESNSIP